MLRSFEEILRDTKQTKNYQANSKGLRITQDQKWKCLIHLKRSKYQICKIVSRKPTQIGPKFEWKSPLLICRFRVIKNSLSNPDRPWAEWIRIRAVEIQIRNPFKIDIPECDTTKEAANVRLDDQYSYIDAIYIWMNQIRTSRAMHAVRKGKQTNFMHLQQKWSAVDTQLHMILVSINHRWAHLTHHNVMNK